MEPRPYRPSDRDACLAVFDSNNLPDRPAFESFLGGPANFTVLEHEGGIVGCGGYSIGPEGIATLLHGMIRRDLRRMGLGRFLLLYRLRQISKSAIDVRFAHLTTTPEAAPFYEKQGFKPSSVREDGTLAFVMKLTVCA